MMLTIGIRNAFFTANVATTQEVLVDGHVQYLRNNETGMFSFQHNISVRNTENNKVTGSGRDTDRETIDEAVTQEDNDKKRKFNLKLWTPIAVVLAILIVLSIKLMVDMHERQ